MITTTLGYSTMHRKISLNVIKINWKAACFMLLLLSLMMLVFYVFTVNQLTQGVFLIKNYNKKVQGLLSENRNLQASFSENDFLGRAIEKAKEFDFEKTANIKYIKVLESSLAKAK